MEIDIDLNISQSIILETTSNFLNMETLLCSPVFVPQIVGGAFAPVPLPLTVNVSVLKIER